MKYALFLFLVICLITISTTNSHAFRCGNEIVCRGDTSASVEANCGQPFHKEYTTERVNDQLKYVQKWYYNCGENYFIYVLTILNSIVVKDDTVRRGTEKSQCNAP
jgi:hypothetical protein